MTKIRKTRIDLSPEVRTKVADLLNDRLADAVDYSLGLKQAHWNIKGRQFIALHEMLDEMYAQSVEYADLIAERGVMLGGQALGTVTTVYQSSNLPEYPKDATSMMDHMHALADRLELLTKSVRAAIDTADSLGDADTADLFTEVSRGLDKHMWYVEAHMED